MADDIVERLRTDVLWHERRGNGTIAADCLEAADEIERLRADLAQAMAERGKALAVGDDLEQENERLRAALAADQRTVFQPTPRDEWATDADAALGHLAGMCFGLFPSDEIGHCVGLVRAALAAQQAPAAPAGMLKLVTEMVALHKQHGTVLTVHMDELAAMLAAAPTHTESAAPGAPQGDA